MMSRKRYGRLIIITGLLFIAAALILTGYNLYDEYKAGDTVSHVYEILNEKISETSQPDGAGQEQAELPDYIINPNMEMPVEEIEGNNYIGVLDIPYLELSLPIMSEWSYPKLKIAPCRYSGSAYTGGFTIAGHNYSTHFGPVRDIPVGTQVIFTDVEGHRFEYEVQSVEVLEPTAIEDMLSDEWDLTLFTCTTGGQARVAVRCLKVNQEDAI